MKQLVISITLVLALIANACGGVGIEGDEQLEDLEQVEAISEALIPSTAIHSSVWNGGVARANFSPGTAYRVIGTPSSSGSPYDHWRAPATNQCYYPGSGFEPYVNSANVYPYLRVDFDMARPINSLWVNFLSNSYNAYYFYMEYCPAGTTCTDVHTGGWQLIDPTNGGSNEVGYRNNNDLTQITLRRTTPVWANAVRIRIECSGEPSSRFPVIRSFSALGPSVMSPQAGGPFAAYRTQVCPAYAAASCRNVDLTQERYQLMHNAASNWGCGHHEFHPGPSPATSSFAQTPTGYYRWYRNNDRSDGDYDCLVFWNPQSETAYALLASRTAAANAGSSVRLYQRYQEKGWWTSNLGFPTTNVSGTANPAINYQYFQGGYLLDN